MQGWKVVVSDLPIAKLWSATFLSSTCSVAVMATMLLAAAPLQAQARTIGAATTADDSASIQPSLPAGVTAGPAMGGVYEFNLANGMKILLVPDDNASGTIVNVNYKVGSLQEDYGATGSAHLLEHMLFKGTPKIPDLVGAFRDRGISFNATTNANYTNYTTTFVATPETLAWVLGAEADRMVNAKVLRSDLDSEMTVVRNELEMGENSQLHLFIYRLQSAAYDWHNYGKATIGARSDVENVSIEKLRDFYRTWYRPDNATLIISGKLDVQRALTLAARTFGAIPTPKSPLPVTHTVEPPQDGEREITIRRPGQTRTIGVAYHIPPITHPDNAVLAVLARIATAERTGRLSKELSRKKLDASIKAEVDAYRDPGITAYIASPDKGVDAATMEAELIHQVEHLSDTPFTEEELTEAKKYFRDMLEMRNGDTSQITSEIIANLSTDWRMMYRRRDDLMNVTTADLTRVARRYFRPSNRTVAIFVPSDKVDLVTVEQGPPVASLVQGLREPDRAMKRVTFDGSLNAIEARTRIVTIGEDLKVAMLPGAGDDPRVTAMLRFRVGDPISMNGRFDAADFAGRMLKMGGNGLTGEEITKRLSDLGEWVNIAGTGQQIIVNVTTTRDKFEEALRLVAGLMRNPTFTEASLTNIKSSWLTIWQSAANNTGSEHESALDRHFDGEPELRLNRNSSTQQRIAGIEAVTLDDVRAFHKDFYGTDHGTGIVTGNFDPQKVEGLLRELFGNWKSPHPYRQAVQTYRPIAPVSQRFERPGRPSADYIARLEFPINADDRDQVALGAASLIFGGGTDGGAGMASRLGSRIRVKEGLSYSILGWIDLPEHGNVGALEIRATTPPQNVERISREIREELQRLLKEGVTQQEVDGARTWMLNGLSGGRSNEGAVGALLMQNLEQGRTLEFQRKLEQWTRDLTVADVNAAIRRHLKPEALSDFASGDFASLKSASAKTQ